MVLVVRLYVSAPVFIEKARAKNVLVFFISNMEYAQIE